MKGNNIVDFELERASRQVSGEADLKKRAALIEKIKTEHSNADNDFPASEVDDMWPYRLDNEQPTVTALRTSLKA